VKPDIELGTSLPPARLINARARCDATSQLRGRLERQIAGFSWQAPASRSVVVKYTRQLGDELYDR
jgi:hypothetical protein